MHFASVICAFAFHSVSFHSTSCMHGLYFAPKHVYISSLIALHPYRTSFFVLSVRHLFVPTDDSSAYCMTLRLLRSISSWQQAMQALSASKASGSNSILIRELHELCSKLFHASLCGVGYPRGERRCTNIIAGERKRWRGDPSWLYNVRPELK
jgi:hypothetical protein